MKYDRSGRLFACEGGANRVVEIDTSDPAAGPSVIADNLDGAKINMPNDIDIDGQGRIYFSDPNYSEKPNNLPHESVYLAEHIFGGNWTVKRVTFDTNRPNGVLLSADQSILYVAESPVIKSYRRQLAGISNQLRRDFGRRHGPVRLRIGAWHRRHGVDD